MKAIDSDKIWDRITNEIHCAKPRRGNLLKRRALFVLQILLNQYELAKKERKEKLENFYTDILKIYKKHSII